MQAVILLKSIPAPGEYLIAGLVDPAEPETSWCGYFGVTEDGKSDFRTYMGLEVPEGNGPMAPPNFMDAHKYTVYYPQLTGMGVGGEIGQKIGLAGDGSSVWYLWVWSFGPSDEMTVHDFTAFIGQYSKQTDTYYAFQDSITVSLNAATATIGVATSVFAAIFALF